MKTAVTMPPAGFEDLPVDQQIDYVQSLWDRIAEAQRKIPSPDWHRSVVRERVAEHESNPEAGRAWSDVRADIDKHLKE
jgi:putative addiction module component (TIGR02574 family)